MDDFRYYSSVGRHREEDLVVLTMFTEDKDLVPTADVIKSHDFLLRRPKTAAGRDNRNSGGPAVSEFGIGS
jgi:hypothetical protein